MKKQTHKKEPEAETPVTVEAQLKKLNRQLSLQLSFKRSFAQSLVNGIGYAIGATIVAGILIAILASTIHSLEDIPVLGALTKSTTLEHLLNTNSR
jgi:hypothetical protein